MSNTLGIPEVTLANIVKNANVVNSIGTGGRMSVLEPLVVRVLGHDFDSGVADESDPYAMALFTSKCYGAPWVADVSTPSTVKFESTDGLTAAPSGANYIVPDFDYSTFG